MKNLPEIPSTNRIIPVVKIDNAARAVELATVLQFARFLVSPGFNLSVCSLALVRGVAPVPGVMTPSEVE
jgi:2-keto-3-deoxy-6-phosphogluconate aldolase